MSKTLDMIKKEVASGQVSDDWVMSRQDKRAATINLGSGVRVEIVYFSMDSIELDEIDSATLVENGKTYPLDGDDIEKLAKVGVL